MCPTICTFLDNYVFFYNSHNQNMANLSVDSNKLLDSLLDSPRVRFTKTGVFPSLVRMCLCINQVNPRQKKTMEQEGNDPEIRPMNHYQKVKPNGPCFSLFFVHRSFETKDSNVKRSSIHLSIPNDFATSGATFTESQSTVLHRCHFLFVCLLFPFTASQKRSIFKNQPR